MTIINFEMIANKDVVVDPARCNFSYFKTQNLTVNMVGRLGNRMFQYAALYGIASANGFIPVVFHDEILTRVSSLNSLYLFYLMKNFFNCDFSFILNFDSDFQQT